MEYWETLELGLPVIILIKERVEIGMTSQVKRCTGQGLSTGVGPYGVGVHHPPSRWMGLSTPRLSKPLGLGCFKETSSYTHAQLLTPSPAPLPSPEKGGREGVKSPNF